MRGNIVETTALEALKENPQAVADFRTWKEKALYSLAGAIMKKTKGKADARTAKEILLEKMTMSNFLKLPFVNLGFDLQIGFIFSKSAGFNQYPPSISIFLLILN